MKKQIESLKSFVGLLNKSKLPYMITGAYAVGYYGRPRATHDLDILIEIKASDLESIGFALKKKYEFDEAMMQNAVTYRTHFTAIDRKTDMRVDLWMVKGKDFDVSGFNRRRLVDLFGTRAYMISAEDILLTKLEWYCRSKNSKHLDDAVGILEVQVDKLDTSYINKWAGRIGIRDLWKKVRAGQYSH